MNTTVDFETAKELREAGFPQPEPKDGQFYFNSRGIKSIIISGWVSGKFDSICLLDGEVQSDISVGDIMSGSIFFAPTALEIIEQMPGEAQYLIGKTSGTTLSILPTGEWVCRWPITAFQNDFRQDTCPHRAAAKAFIAWKKGKE